MLITYRPFRSIGDQDLGGCLHQAARPSGELAARCRLSFLSRAAFEAFAEKHPELCRSLLRLLAKRVRERDKIVAATSFLSLKGRIAQTLLELGEHFGQEVGPGRIVMRQRIRQTDLAAMAGIARENVTRILNDNTTWEIR